MWNTKIAEYWKVWGKGLYITGYLVNISIQDVLGLQILQLFSLFQTIADDWTNIAVVWNQPTLRWCEITPPPPPPNETI